MHYCTQNPIFIQTLSREQIGKWVRSRIFLGMLELTAGLPGVQLFNVCLDRQGRADPQLDAWDRLLNRLERTMLEMENRETRMRTRLMQSVRDKLSEEDAELIGTRLMIYRARAFIIADEGREPEITRAFRRMHVHNPVPSQYGVWPSGARTRNIPTDRLIEDPVFKKSHRSYFLQLADCAAFALLKREVAPTPLVNKYGIHEMFDDTLARICFRPACRTDPLGIVRR